MHTKIFWKPGAVLWLAGLLAQLLLPSFALAAQSPSADIFNPTAGVFNLGAPSSVHGLAVQPDGKVLISGEFDTLGGQNRTNLGRVNSDGTLDLTFNPPRPFDRSTPLVVQPDGKILVLTDGPIARLNDDGSPDLSFNPSADQHVGCFALQADGKIVVGGGVFFDQYIWRLKPDGTVDGSFANTTMNNSAGSIALQEDGKIVIGGNFTLLNGQPRSGLGRLNADGTLDTNFVPPDLAPVYSLAVQIDGKVLIGGLFETLGGQPHKGLARLNADGTLDTSFNPQTAAGPFEQTPVWAFAVQADGRIVAGGVFSSLDGQTRYNLGRLNINGTLETAFNAGTDYPCGNGCTVIYGLAGQADGKMVVGGIYGMLAGQTRVNIGRLNNGGATSHSLSFDGSVLTWMRGGTSPEVWRTTFERLDGSAWLVLGAGTRVSGGWQLTGLAGLALPTNTTIRARGYMVSGIGNTSASFVEEVLNPALTISGARVARGMTFNVLGPAGQSVVIDVSADLRAWAPLQTNTLGVAGLRFADPQAADLPTQFYRARAAP